MKIALIPVTVSDRVRVTTLTRAWIERACASVNAYIQDQSGGQQTAEFTVFDWVALTQTFQQWQKLGSAVREPVNKQVASDLSGYEHFVYIIDDGVSSVGATWRNLATSIIAARDLDPALLAHEITHVFGPDDTFLYDPKTQESIHYGGLFCVMGLEGAKHSLRDQTLLSPSEGANAGHTDCGPGMCVPTLLATGWFTLAKYGVQATWRSSKTHSDPITIRVLDGTPRAEGGLPVCCYIDDGNRYMVEYRISTSKWDAGLPASKNGWLVVNRTPIDEKLETLEVAHFPAEPGNMVSFREGPEFLYEFGGGMLVLSVLACDVIAGTVVVQFSRTIGKPPQYIEEFEGFRRELRYVLWSPVSGWLTFPADSDLAVVLKNVETLSQLRDLAQANNSHYAADLNAAIERQNVALHESTWAIGPRIDTARVTLVDRLGQLREKVGTNLDLSELTKELEQLQYLAQEVS